MFEKLYAICLLVENFEKSLEFYKNTLGLIENSRDAKYADFMLGESLLAIFQKDEATAMFSRGHMKSGGGVAIAFPVENVEKICEELKQKGIHIFEGPKTTPWGQTVAYFNDPDDNILEITASL